MAYNWFVAQRLFAHSDNKDKVSASSLRIATIGVLLGVAIMLISVSVVTGFQREIKDKVMGLGSHIQIQNYRSLSSVESVPIVIDPSLMAKVKSIPHVSNVQRFCTKRGMLKTDSAFNGIIFRGVGQEYDTTFLARHLVEGKLPRLNDTSPTGQILISQTQADQLGLGVGDKVYAYFYDESFKARLFSVSGIYSTNMTDFDQMLVFSDLATIHNLLKWDTHQMSGAEIRLDDPKYIPEVMPQIVRMVNKQQDAYGETYTSLSVKDLYPQVFSWLSLLNLDVWVILILMTLVAGFTVVSGLLIIILERTNFIGVMKALGSTNGQLRQLFLYFAMFIILRGMVLGNILAFAFLYLQKYFEIVKLNPQVYYVDAVPIEINWWYVVLVNVFSFIVSMLALFVPSYLVSNIHPARSMKFE